MVWIGRGLALAVACAAVGSLAVRSSHSCAQQQPRVHVPVRSQGDSVAPAATEETISAEETYTLYRWSFPLATTALEVLDVGMTQESAPRLLESKASLVINAGFFDVDDSVDGLSYARGHLYAPVKASLSGGVIQVRQHHATLHEAESYQLQRDAELAIQCRPRLVVDGAVNIRRETGLRADRTALCIREHGTRLDVYVARTESGNGMSGPTLLQLAERLRADGCEQALNLDGGPSTGAAWRQNGRAMDMRPRKAVRQWLAFYAHARAAGDSPR